MKQPIKILQKVSGPKVDNPTKRKHYYKKLGTSVINSPMSPLSLLKVHSYQPINSNCKVALLQKMQLAAADKNKIKMK